MFRYHVISMLLVLLVAACSSTTPRLSKDLVDDIRQAKVAVAFFDFSHNINYINEIYEVLNITTKVYYSSYNGYWDSDTDVTEIHTKGLLDYGIKAKSIHKVLNKQQVKTMRTMYNQFRLDQRLDRDAVPVLSNQVNAFLSEQDIHYLILIDWSGYSLLIKSQGLPPRELITMKFSLFETTKGKRLWQGNSAANKEIDIQNKNPKYFLEDNDFAELKMNVKQLILSRYQVKANNVGQIMGLKNPYIEESESTLFTDVQE